MSFAIYDWISGGTPNYAKQAEEAERKRQLAITTGTSDINKAFQGFDPQFYQKRAQDYIRNAMPQLSDQYRTTSGQIGFGIANRGAVGGSSARKQWSDLFRTTQAAKQGIVDTGIGQAQDLKRQVENQRQTLINQLYATADPANAQQAAVAAAAGFQTPSTFAPLVNQFSGLLNQYYTSSLLNQQRQQPMFNMPSYGAQFAPLPGATTSSGGGYGEPGPTSPNF